MPLAKALVIHVVLLNDGAEPWKEGASLCEIGGNASRVVTSTCQVNRQMARSCKEVLPGEIAELVIRVLLQTDRRDGLRQSKFSLCDSSEKPFGILMSLRMHFRKSRGFDEKGSWRFVLEKSISTCASSKKINKVMICDDSGFFDSNKKDCAQKAGDSPVDFLKELDESSDSPREWKPWKGPPFSTSSFDVWKWVSEGWLGC